MEFPFGRLKSYTAPADFLLRGLPVGETTAEQDPTPEKRQLLAETRADLLSRQLSNAENYDKAVLTLSTAFLGISFAFLKDFVPIDRAVWLCLLYGSWVVLTGSVMSTIISFWLSQRAIDVQLRKAEDYYLRDDQCALNKSRVATATDWVNAVSGVLFVLGVSLTTVFVIVNLERSLKMSDDKKVENVPLREAASIPKMQEVPLKRGAPIPNFQPAPQSRPQQSQPPAQSTPSAAPANSKTSSDGKK